MCNVEGGMSISDRYRGNMDKVFSFGQVCETYIYNLICHDTTSNGARKSWHILCYIIGWVT